MNSTWQIGASTESGHADSDTVDGYWRLAWVGVSVLIAAKLAFLFIFAWHSRFVMDEFAQFGWAKYLGHGLFETIWHPKAVGYAVFYKLAHLIGWDATSLLRSGRMQTAFLACATLALVYGCARSLGNDRLRSLVVILVLLCFSNFIERSFRTIAEPLAVFFAAAALLIVLRGQADRARTVLGAGVLGGLSFLATQKAIYFDVALGLALVTDAAMGRDYRRALIRGLWLVLGWTLPIIVYCLIFGAAAPLPIAKNLFLGPIDVATIGGDAYGNLRGFVWQTLLRNFGLYLLCFGGMIIELLRLRGLDERRRIALIFTTIIAALVFAHNQPWPYVFLMVLPFMALWAVVPIDRFGTSRMGWVCAALGLVIAISFVRNGQYLRIDNRAQLDLVARAEPLLGPTDIYFDGVGMLPNRREPSILWLDRATVLQTLRQKSGSEAYRIFATAPPKLILWTTRMDAIEPVVGPLIRHSYVAISPNVRIAGRRLLRDRPVGFDVPLAGPYALYDRTGAPLGETVEIDGAALRPPFNLVRGSNLLTLRGRAQTAYLLPKGDYAGRLQPGRDNVELFERVYD